MKAAMLLAAAILAGTAGTSEAGAGMVQGRLLFWNAQGNFCPDGRDCTGARYLQSSFQTNLGIPQTKLYLRNTSNQVIGQSVTDVNGNFVMVWFDPAAPATTVAYLETQLEHKDGRFTVHNAGGGALYYRAAPIVVGANTNAGNLTWGNSGAPDPFLNVYHGAWRSWFDSLGLANVLVTYFGNVDIRGFDNTCATSCANGIFNRIQLDTGAAFSPQGRILHELGHLASYKASQNHERLQAFNVYCYPATGGSCGWSLNTPEWGSATFEEALATFFGDAALYAQDARRPHTCLSAGACPEGVFDLEASVGVACPTDFNRHPINNARYLWDLYDNRADYSSEGLSMSVGQIADTITSLPDGYDNGGKNEPFWGLTMDDNDGRSSMDFHMRLMFNGTQNILQLMYNCGGVGD